MKKKVPAILVCVIVLSGVVLADTFGTGDNQFEIEFVPISGSTNPTSGYGIVNNDYRMGTYEVNNAQWTKFKATYGAVTGSPLDAYDRDPYFTNANVPTNCASWYEAAQFVNYLNTSTDHQAAYKFTGTQGQSDYTFTPWAVTDTGYNAGNPYRNSNAFYFLPTENEWVKAAYWNGTSLQTYANASAGDLVSGLPDPAKWNYSGNEPWAVGSGSQELNGTYDMMGNVWEWMESPKSSGDYLFDSLRGARGGSYDYYDSGGGYYLASSYRGDCGPDYDYGASLVGFRVASIPEPATILLLTLGGLALMKKRR